VETLGRIIIRGPYPHSNAIIYMHLQFAFSALTLLVGRQEGHPACKKAEWWRAGVVVCLEPGADLHTAQLMPLPLTVSASVKSRLVLPFWYRLTRVVLYKGPLNVCLCVCVCVCVCVVRRWSQALAGSVCPETQTAVVTEVAPHKPDSSILKVCPFPPAALLVTRCLSRCSSAALITLALATH